MATGQPDTNKGVVRLSDLVKQAAEILALVQETNTVWHNLLQIGVSDAKASGKTESTDALGNLGIMLNDIRAEIQTLQERISMRV